MACGTSADGGGTKVASFSAHPAGPIQFCVVRNSLGCRSFPQTPFSSRLRISRMGRTETGSSANRASPWVMAST